MNACSSVQAIGLVNDLAQTKGPPQYSNEYARNKKELRILLNMLSILSRGVAKEAEPRGPTGARTSLNVSNC